MNKVSIRNLVTFIVICISILHTQNGVAQLTHNPNNKEQKRAKIGVVLSGGGALGLAHIGVLKVLEERGIKPDFIVGTSMGSVVGGLYALGYTADEITELTQAINWETVLSSHTPLTYVSFEEKQDYNRYTITFPVKDGKPSLPTGLIEGQLLLETLTEFTWSGINYTSFDDYPIPFRCVALDVSTGKEKIFDKGSLALAMRSSMAIPTIFTAVNLDSTLYVDGGAINNFPVDVAIDLGADIIIGSDVTTGLVHAYEIENLAGILYQTAMFPSLLKMKQNIANTDVYIHPDVSHFTAADFTKAESIIQTGYKEATNQINALDSLCLSIDYQPQEIISQVQTYPDTILLSNVNYNTKDTLHISQVEDRLNCVKGTNLAIKSFENDTRLLYGSLKYKNISYWAEPDTNIRGAYNFDMNFDKSPRTDIKIGLHYDNVFSVGVVANLTTHDFLLKKSRLKLKLDISPNFKGEAEIIKHFGKKNNFNILADYSYFLLNQPVYVKGVLDEYNQNGNHQFSFKFQSNQSLNSKFGLGYYFSRTIGRSTVGNEAFKNIKVKSTFNILFAEFQLNTLNKNYHPTQGSRLSIRSDVVMSNSFKVKFPSGQEFVNFPVDSIPIPITEDEINNLLHEVFTPTHVYLNLFLKYKQFFRISDKVKFITNIGSAVTLGPKNEIGIYRPFNTGGNINLFYFDYQVYGLNYAESQTNNLAIARADFMISPVNNLFMYAGANLMLFKDYGLNEKSSTTGSFIDSDLLGYGINIAYKTALGPIELGASKNNRDANLHWNFQIGFQF